VSDTYFGLLSYVKSVDAPFAIGAIDAGMAAAGFALRQTSEGESVREYSNADGWRLKCITSLASGPSSFHDADQWGVWGFFPVDYEDLARHGPAPLVTAFRDVCVRSRTVFGRSFSPKGFDLIERAELDGRIDFLGWIQYFGPAMSNAIGLARLEAAGFASFERLDNGGCLALTRPGYLDPFPPSVAKQIVDRLGITPRRIMTKWDEGKEIEIRWY
jgi:hypothetical protein